LGTVLFSGSEKSSVVFSSQDIRWPDIITKKNDSTTMSETVEIDSFNPIENL
jgi:hypothetical protein